MGSLLSKELQTDSYYDKSGAAAERSREGELELVIRRSENPEEKLESNTSREQIYTECVLDQY